MLSISLFILIGLTNANAINVPSHAHQLREDGVIAAAAVLLLTNTTHTDVISLNTGSTVATIERKYPGVTDPYTAVSKGSGGDYYFFVSAFDGTGDAKVTQQQLSSDGLPMGLPVDLAGYFYSDPIAEGNDGKRVLIIFDNYDANIYDLDAVNSSVVALTGHTDYVVSVVYSPNKTIIASTGLVSSPHSPPSFSAAIHTLTVNTERL
jgi:hypothetical protein